MLKRVWFVLLSSLSLALNCGLVCAQSEPPRPMPDFGAVASQVELNENRAPLLFSESPNSFPIGGRIDDLSVFRLEDSVEDSSSLELVQYPLEFSASEDALIEEPDPLPKLGPFGVFKQKLACIPEEDRGLRFGDTAFVATYLPGGGDDGLGISTFNAKASVFMGQFPIFRVGPRFGWHQLNGPPNFDVPSHLFDIGIEFTLALPLSAKWKLITRSGPSLFTDGENLSSQGMRITASVMGFYEWSETTSFAVGMVYLDRQDIRALPAAGVFYQPNEYWKFDIFFPRPRVSYRLMKREDREYRVYLAGELGGGSWAVERSSGAEDLLTYRDYRLVTGFEQSSKDSLRWLVEGGYVFGRELEYQSPGSSFKPSSTGMIRAGITF